MATALLLHLDGADASTTIIDHSQFPGKSLTCYGNAALATWYTPRFGTASLWLDGAGDYVQSATHAAFQPAGDWTVEGWLQASATLARGGIFYFGDLASNTNRIQFWVEADGTLNFYTNQGGGTFGPLTTVTGVVTTGVWRHFAVVKSGTTISLYYNGTRRHTFDTGFSTNTNNGSFAIGAARDVSGGALSYFKGALDEVRYDNTTALYTGTSYTIPTAPFTDPVAVDYATPTAPTALTVYNANAGTPTAPTALTITQAAYAPTAPTQLTIYATGTPTAPTALAVINPGLATQWTAQCLISGVDVSARLTGAQTVEADEGAARTATVQLLPSSGPLAVLDYVGRLISLDFVRIVSGTTVPIRIFTGRVDTPVYDLSTGIITLSCTDDLQNRLAAMPRTTLDLLIGGRYAVAVQGEILDNWDYAQARMTTVAASLDSDAFGGLRVTPWDGLPLFRTLGGADLLYARSSISFPQRTDIINRVEIDYEYRYPRLRQRYTTVGFSATRAEMNQQGYLYPTQQEITAAVGGSGWVQTLGVFYPAPVTIPHSTGGKVRPRAGAIDMAIIYLTQRHGQEVTEQYSIVVEAPESVTQNGILPHDLRGALASEFDYQVWEADLALPPLMPTGGEQDYAPDAPRADSDYAIQTLLDQARVKILASHRGAEVSNATTCNPQIDLNKRIRILTGTLDADGKVRRVSHTLDLATGSATTDFSIALFGAGGAGIITPDALTPPVAPPARAATQDWGAAVPSLWVNIYGVTAYSPNLMGLLLNPEQFYTVEDVPDGLGGFTTQSYTNPFYVAGSYPETGFRIAMPGVDAGDRNPVNVLTPKTYSIVLPANTLTITAP